MKTIGIDIGTTTISGVVLEKNETQKARILEAKTIENGSFLATDSDWERIQDALDYGYGCPEMRKYRKEEQTDAGRFSGQISGSGKDRTYRTDAWDRVY